MRASDDKALSAQDAEAEVLREFDKTTQQRMERIRQFAEAIRMAIRTRRRQHRGLTQAQLAERLGVSVSTISRLESGRGISGLDFGVAVAAIAELDAEPMLTLLDPGAPGACEVADLTLPDQRSAQPPVAKAAGLQGSEEPEAATEPSGLGSGYRALGDASVAVGFQSELEAMRKQMSRLTDAVQNLSQANQRRSSE